MTASGRRVGSKQAVWHILQNPAYRFGGERICTNRQIQAEFLEAAVWREVCDLLRNPEKLEQDFKESSNAVASLPAAEAP